MKNGSDITLPKSLRNWAEAQATLGGFDNVDEFISQVLREERKRLALDSIEQKLLDALDSGPASPMTASQWKELRQLARVGPKSKKRHAAKR